MAGFLGRSSQPDVRDSVGMKRWLRLTARRKAAAPTPPAAAGRPAAGRPVADAAAEALAELLKGEKKAS
jgi:hypothetical protein